MKQRLRQWWCARTCARARACVRVVATVYATPIPGGTTLANSAVQATKQPTCVDDDVTFYFSHYSSMNFLQPQANPLWMETNSMEAKLLTLFLLGSFQNG